MTPNATNPLTLTATKPTLRRGALHALFSLCIITSLFACSAGPRNFENDNDRLRREVLDLTAKNEALQRQVDSLTSALAAEQKKQQASRQPLPQGVTLPVLSRVELAAYSGGIDTDNDNIDDALRLYITPLDQHSRFIQVVGTLRVTITAAAAGKDAVTLATAEFSPQQLSSAYRSSSLGGTHYTFVIPLTTPPPAGVKQVHVKLALHDATTDHAVEHESLVRFTSRK